MTRSRVDEDGMEVVDLTPRVDGGTTQRVSAPADHDGPRRSRRPLVIAAVVLVVLGAWLLIAYLTVADSRDALYQVRDDLGAAQTALLSGDVEAAREVVADARDDLEGVRSRLRSPLVAPVRVVPRYGRSLDAAAALTDAGVLAASAAEEIIGAFDDEGLAVADLMPREGRIPIDAVQALVPALQEGHVMLAEALATARDVSVGGVDDRVVDGRQAFIDLLDPLAGQLQTAGAVAELLPSMFGADGPRTYLILAANPAEARGAGGFFGAYMVAQADAGELTFGEVGQTWDLPTIGSGLIEFPAPSLEDRWEPYGGDRIFRNINMTPDFPSAATMVEHYWEAVFDQTLDGVVSVDPFAFESLLRLTGAIEVPDAGTVTADEVVEFVTHESYQLLDEADVRKELIGEVAAAALSELLAGDVEVDLDQVGASLASMAHRDSLLIHTTDPDEQALLSTLGVAGAFEPVSGDLLAVILNSGNASKIDYFLRRSVSYEVVLGPNGMASGVVSAGLVNEAPTEGEPSHMINPPGGVVPPGDNLTYLSVYGPPGSTFLEVPDDGFQDLVTDEGVELGHPVTSTWVQIPSGQAQELHFTYTGMSSWRSVGADRVYELTYAHQPSVTPIDLDIRVQVPEGFEVRSMPDGAEMEDGWVVWELQATADEDFAVRLSPVQSQ